MGQASGLPHAFYGTIPGWRRYGWKCSCRGRPCAWSGPGRGGSPLKADVLCYYGRQRPGPAPEPEGRPGVAGLHAENVPLGVITLEPDALVVAEELDIQVPPAQPPDEGAWRRGYVERTAGEDLPASTAITVKDVQRLERLLLPPGVHHQEGSRRAVGVAGWPPYCPPKGPLEACPDWVNCPPKASPVGVGRTSSSPSSWSSSEPHAATTAQDSAMTSTSKAELRNCTAGPPSGEGV